MQKAVLTGEIFTQGDIAAAEGALAAGCRFFAGYPITPATEIAERMAYRLPRVGGRYSDDWQRLHLMDPRALVPESNMPGYPWLAERNLDPELITSKLKVLQFLGDGYSDEQIAAAAAEVEGRTELDAVVAYLQGLGTNRRTRR